jgi:predicted nucleic acid-binding protein
MTDIVFVDSNILIYAHDADAGAKRASAVEALRQLWDSGGGRMSVQVLQEFYVNVTRKLKTPVARLTAREVVSPYGA